jgi:triacylglycerol lipase
MARRRPVVFEDQAEADIAIWKEALFGAELLLLHASPVYYGFGVPRGNGEGVVIIPGFLGTDLYLAHLRNWLTRIGYSAYVSGIGFNAECPNLLIERRLNETIDTALKETGKRVHLIGHSLGGVIARSVATQRSADIASVITIASPFRGAVAHQSVLRAAEYVRRQILHEHGPAVLPQCFTPKCTCSFIESLHVELPQSITQTAIYTKNDGVVDWHYCVTEDEGDDFEVPGTHIGLVFNSSVYSILANRLTLACSSF